MTYPSERQSPSDNDILDNLEFTPNPLSLEEQQLALLDMQSTIVDEWADDANSFMVRLIDRLPSNVDTASQLTRFSLGLRQTDDAIGVRTEEVVVYVHSKLILPGLTSGNAPRMQRIDKYIPIASTIDGDRKVSHHFDAGDADLIEGQIARLRGLQALCPNISDDLMTITSMPSRAPARLWRSDAFLAARSQP